MPDKRKHNKTIDYLWVLIIILKALYLPLHYLEYEPADHFHIQDLQMTVS